MNETDAIHYAQVREYNFKEYFQKFQYNVLISLYRYQVYHCNRYHASAAIGTARITANGTKFIGSA